MSSPWRDIHSIPEFLSGKGDSSLEEWAQKARRAALKKFGKTILLYTPVYLSNECTNACKYCGFSVKNDIPRKTLSYDEMQKEFETISGWGIKHILLVTGEAPHVITEEYLVESVKLAKTYFPSVSLEIYPMDVAGYRRLVEVGVDGLSLYQETYHQPTYKSLHCGPKADFKFRRQAVENACEAGIRRIGVGALLGLYDPVFEMTELVKHLRDLKKRYWQTYFSVSFPRLRKAEKGIAPAYPVSDKLLVKMIILTRLFFDDVGIVISTRECAALRDNLIPLGVTQMSAGSRTEPGGYEHPDEALKQFEIEDDRLPDQLAAQISRVGYEPVWKDWDRGLL